MNGKQECYLLFGNSITKGTQKTSKIIKINKSIKPKGACEEKTKRERETEIVKEWKLFRSKKELEKIFSWKAIYNVTKQQHKINSTNTKVLICKREIVIKSKH